MAYRPAIPPAPKSRQPRSSLAKALLGAAVAFWMLCAAATVPVSYVVGFLHLDYELNTLVLIVGDLVVACFGARWTFARLRWGYVPWHAPEKCELCGYDLTANVSGICPECGTPVSKAPESTVTPAK